MLRKTGRDPSPRPLRPLQNRDHRKGDVAMFACLSVRVN
jgi:hypothetical protein